jgi:hypothetical protein
LQGSAAKQACEEPPLLRVSSLSPGLHRPRVAGAPLACGYLSLDGVYVLAAARPGGLSAFPTVDWSTHGESSFSFGDARRSGEHHE